MQNKNPLFNNEKCFVTLTYLVVILEATHWPQPSAERKTDHQVKIPIALRRINNAEKIGQGDSLFWAAESILSALISDNSFTFSVANLLSPSLSFYFSLLSLKDRSEERGRSCLRLSYRLSQPCREKFLAICWIQVRWCALVAHLWLHFLTWHSCD